MSPIAWLANTSRFAAPRSAWNDIRFRTGGQTRAIAANDIVPARGAWSTDPGGEIEGSPGAIAWIATPNGKSFSVSASVVRPDGIQGVILDNDTAVSAIC